MNDSNKFIRFFGYGSSLMLILFDFLLNKAEDSNNSSDILNIILSCRLIYETCNIFILRRRIKWSGTINFDQNKLNSIVGLLYDSEESINDRLIKIPNLKKLVFGWCFNQPLKEGYLPSSLTQLTFGWAFNQPLKEGYLPSKLTKLTINKKYEKSLRKIILSSSLCVSFFD